MFQNKITLPFLVISCVSLLICSCEKPDDDNDQVTPVPLVYENYSQLKVGNYWIYQRFEVDSLGNGIPTSVYDSCYVEKDTLINNQVYFKVFRPQPASANLSYLYLRDSLHYTVSSSGEIVFSSLDFITIFADYYFINVPDTIYRCTTRMADQNLVVSTPAGNLVTSNFKKNYEMFGGMAMNGLNRPINTRYSKDVGMVTETLIFFAFQTTYSERRLVSYHLN